MKDKVTYYKLVNNFSNNARQLSCSGIVENAEETEPNRVFFYNGKIFNDATGELEKVLEIKREDSELNRSRYELAHKKFKESSIEEINSVLPTAAGFFFEQETTILPSYKMSYDADEIENITTRHNFIYLFCSETITVQTEKNIFTVDTNDVRFISRWGSDDEIYRADLYTKENIIFLDVYSNRFLFSDDKPCGNVEVDSLSLNLETGLIYRFYDINPKTRKCREMKNVTTGNLNSSKFALLPDEIFDDIKKIISEYWTEKTGVTPTFYDLFNKMDTFRSMVFNPNCNVVYLYKPFFNTRFRNYFKRDDMSVNHFEELCKLIGLEYNEKYIEFVAKYPKNLFAAKVLSDAGVKKVDNQISMINTLHECPWGKSMLGDFIDKFYGENTDFLYAPYDSSKNSMEALCIYVEKAIPYTSEDEFVAMFNRSFNQHNKYWQRSLHQVATVIRLGGGSRELLRKACSYGLNKIQSDNIDLAYDKILSKNLFMTYPKEITDQECVISDAMFKLPLETNVCASLLSNFKFSDEEASKISYEVAERKYNVIFVKDKNGEAVGCLKYRGNLLLDVAFTKGSTKLSANDARIACIEWCDRFGIKQYRCKDLQHEIKTSNAFYF